MDETTLTASNFMPRDLLEIICILERGEKCHSYKIIAPYINFNQNTNQIQVLTKLLCCAQAIFYWLPNNEWGTKYRGLTYSAK